MRLQAQSTPSLSGLPSEILHQIAEVLDATHPRSLVAFAQTSKRLYAVASRFLFSTIKFTPLTDGKLLAKDVETWERILLRDGALQYVRRLILHWEGLYDGSGPLHSPYLSLKECERSDSDTNLETCWDLYDQEWCGGTKSSIKEHEWALLARLLKKLTGLADFIFADPGPFPPGFLQILHDQLSTCRLHHYTFRLSTSDEASLQPDEQSLITSPCLYTIGDLSAIISYSFIHVETLLLARRNAPSLRRVFSFCHGPRRKPNYGCDADDVYNLPGLPALEYLQISSFFNVYSQRWHRPPIESLSPRVIDCKVLNKCNALRVLKLNTPMRDQPLPAPSNFPSLVTLSVVCPRDSSTPAWSDSFLAFLRGLPSLKALRVLGWPRSTSFTPGLNTELQKLHLDTWHTPGGPPLLQDHVLQLPIRCPALEELAIEIKRSRGDAAEVACYRALGRLPRLRRLKLTLDVDPPPIIPNDIVEVSTPDQRWKPYYPYPGHTNIEPWFEEGWDMEFVRGLHPHRNGHVRDLLVNSAVDSGLALSIFDVINSAKVFSLVT